MPPESDGSIKTIGCSLKKLIPNAVHLREVEDAVHRVHRACFLAIELLNIHIRVCIEKGDSMSGFFDRSFVRKAFNEVTKIKDRIPGDQETVHHDALHDTRMHHMAPFDAPSRSKVDNLLNAAALNIATVAKTNVWMHFKARVKAHIYMCRDKGLFIIKDDDKKRLVTLHIANDMCKHPNDPFSSPEYLHDWIVKERQRIGIDVAVGAWNSHPLLWHLKARPHNFVRIMALMASEREANGKSSFAIYPLRRRFVPCHIEFDAKALADLFSGVSRIAKRKRSDEFTKEEDNEDFRHKKEEIFYKVLDLRAANVQQRWSFNFSFTTDGVCARLHMKKEKQKTNCELKRLPRRGIWAIDELKRVSRLEDMHVVGIDPGKRELIVGVDMDDPKSSPVVRYTQNMRLKDTRSRQYESDLRNEKPDAVVNAEKQLVGFNSRSISLHTFCDYCVARRSVMNVCFEFYSGMQHRQRRWKRYVKTQKSEENLYRRLKTIQKDERPLVLAYGSWGMVAGRPGMACNKGNSPCIGVGLMRKLSKRFPVALTPEAYTSKTCCRCLGNCGRWTDVEDSMHHKTKRKSSEIRGLRVCQNTECRIPLNRDKNGATNIGRNFERLFSDQPPIRSMTDEDIAFHRASMCILCE
jgi:hypothetical protein